MESWLRNLGWAAMGASAWILAQRSVSGDELEVKRVRAQEFVLVDSHGDSWGAWKTLAATGSGAPEAVLELSPPSGGGALRIGCYPIDREAGSRDSRATEFRIEFVQEERDGGHILISSSPWKGNLSVCTTRGERGVKIGVRDGRSIAAIEAYSRDAQRAVLGEYVLDERVQIDTGGPTLTSSAASLTLEDGPTRCVHTSSGEVWKRQ